MTDLIPKGFLYKEASVLEAKIIGFKTAGVNQLQLVLDFDRTLTAKNDQNSTSWQLMRSHLPPEGQVEAQKVYDYYRALEVAEKLTAKDATAWWSGSMAIITKYHLDMTTVEHDFLSQSTIRSGTKELFALCAQHNIPTIIMSAGIKDVIDIWCKTYDIHPTIILSTALKLDGGNHVVGWDESTIVHTLNKRELGHPELTKIRAERSHTILAGDSIHDFDMADGTDNVFRIRIVDFLSEETSKRNAIEEKSYKVFDAIINDGSLTSIYQLLQEIIE